MKKYFSFLIIFLFSISKLFSQTTGDVTDISTIEELTANGMFDLVWQPSIVKSNDAYLVAYGRHLRGKADMGDVVCSISYDRGKTWNPAVTIFDHTIQNGTRKFAYNNAVLYKDPDQDVIWCFAMRGPQHFEDSEDSELCGAYSGDGGKTWYQVELVVDLHSPIITCAGIQKIARNNKPVYLLPGHRNTRRHDPMGDCQHFILESSDLLHWKLAGYIPFPEPKVFMCEGHIAQWNSPNQLKIVTRTANYQDGNSSLNPPTAYSSISDDGGKTWSMGKPEPALYNSVAKAYFGVDSLKRHVYVYSSGPAWERKELWYKTKDPNKEWSNPKRFYFNNNKNSYPSLIDDRNGEWLCVWDSSNDPNLERTVIRFGRLKIK